MAKRNPSVKTLRVYKRRFVLIVLIPMFTLLAVFNFIPILSNFVISFYNYNLLGNSLFVGLQNYLDIPKIDEFATILRNTFFFAFVTSILNIVLATTLAMCISSLKKKRSQDFFRATFFLPAVLPIVAIAYVWVVMFDGQSGIINAFLSQLGYTDPIYWLKEPGTAMASVIVVTLFVDLGYNLVLILSGLDNIPKTYLEAAQIDGASPLRCFFGITLPLLSRTMSFVCIMTMISYFQVFSQIDVLTRGGPGRATYLLPYAIYDYAFRRQDMGMGAALAVLLLIILIVLSGVQLLLNKTDWEY